MPGWPSRGPWSCRVRPSGIRIEQLTVTGLDAAEFGVVRLHPLPSVPSRLRSLPTAVTLPAALPAGQAFTVSIAPRFHGTGSQRAGITVHYRDARNVAGVVRAALTASVSN